MLMEIRSCRGQSTHPVKSDHRLGWMSTGWRTLRLTSVSHKVPASFNWPALLENLSSEAPGRQSVAPVHRGMVRE